MANYNYHLTEAGASRSVGATMDAPGRYPATATTAPRVVAPGAYVRSWVTAEHLTDDTIAQAVRAWDREQA